ncbi:heme exporter protein CcmD [Fulvimarina sp. 2208YS6-2-32]|uniref:Heme exporter protein D n=1 Tax=Fulvimarina uroteuthidis TaxID=3098149 RepID=A0ABU5HYM3_9HYPH|nr:heme exporter protein CcmD [Fulvimarina sp. 2208YS6-2-32]MDY8108210.1 heme exporter protein CcmD [Fulvimarina sp. 2208YS6-2-32]
MSGDYTGFILAAYGFSALFILLLMVWIVVDARAQARALKDLEARGIRRRSAPQPANLPEGAQSR